MMPPRAREITAWVATATVVVGVVLGGCGGPDPVARDDLAFASADGKTKKHDAGAPAEAEQPNGTSLGDPVQEPEPVPRNDGGGASTSTPAPGACAKDAECNQAGRICTAGACVKGCHTTAQCTSNQTCTAGQCVFTQANVECVADVDCALGAICTSSACVPGCHASYDCPTGQTCTAGQCKAATSTSTGTTPPQCLSDGACNPGTNGAGKICSAQGTCVPGCHKDNQCPGTTICVTGMCK